MIRPASFILATMTLVLGGCNKAEIAALQQDKSALEARLAKQEAELNRINASMTAEANRNRAAAAVEAAKEAAVLEAKGKVLAAVELQQKQEKHEQQKQSEADRRLNEEVEVRLKEYRGTFELTERSGNVTLVILKDIRYFWVSGIGHWNTDKTVFPFRRGSAVSSIKFSDIGSIEFIGPQQRSPKGLTGYFATERNCKLQMEDGVELEGYLCVGDVDGRDNSLGGILRGSDPTTKSEAEVKFPDIDRIRKLPDAELRQFVRRLLGKPLSNASAGPSSFDGRSVIAEKSSVADALINATLRINGYDPNTAEARTTREIVKASLDPRLSSEQQMERIQRSVETLMKSK